MTPRLHPGDRLALGPLSARIEAAGAPHGIVRAENGVATGRIGAGTTLQIVDALLIGAHEPGTSHHALPGAFLDEAMLRRVDAELAANHHRTHEFGNSALIGRRAAACTGTRRCPTCRQHASGAGRAPVHGPSVLARVAVDQGRKVVRRRIDVGRIGSEGRRPRDLVA